MRYPCTWCGSTNGYLFHEDEELGFCQSCGCASHFPKEQPARSPDRRSWWTLLAFFIATDGLAYVVNTSSYGAPSFSWLNLLPGSGFFYLLSHWLHS